METQMEKVSYIIGHQIGADFKVQGLDINSEIFLNSFKLGLKGQASEISADETQVVMSAFQTEMEAKASAIAAEAGKENISIGETYLSENKAKDGVELTASGLQYKVIKSGEGKTPTAESTVETHYEGTLIDGTVFDSSYKRNQTATFPVNGVIPGWTEALQLMKEGDVWELTIPSDLAYGANGAGAQIGPHSVLNFKIELVNVL
jgi:FKBP-type peptidyl-prolyl cis-trans isomerase FklB